jgi:nitrate/TMAO reductase-like tetraheme cytochrome c subunit
MANNKWGVRAAFMGLVVGIALAGGSVSAVKYTNSVDFCITCHEMKEHSFSEYAKSSHYANASGVQATCADCHVDKSSWPVMLVDKGKKGAYDIYQHLRGSIDTPEKYEAKKAELVTRVTERMRANDSAACRRCHVWSATKLEAQTDRAKNAHEKMKPTETCIDCHQGVVHESNKPDSEEQGFML